MVTIEAPCSELHKAHDRLFGWCKQNNRATGLCSELYQHPEPRFASSQTDLFVEVKS
jgi:hypothetical protein